MDLWMRKTISNQQAALTALQSNLSSIQSSLKGYCQEISAQYHSAESQYLMSALDEILAMLQTDLNRCTKLQNDLRRLEQSPS